ncbi:MAG: acyl-CoA dehydrogenase [Deltaproteobacteria bacterium]|nr:acyl-CoA dehydrogenase [Deltaproteobacteria bacterium]MBW2444344.1 acyl-CoA dehydrogenase [Deltaproteobacteria bacterium]
MDFRLSEEQEALREVARDFLAARWPADKMRAALDAQPALVDDDVWKEIVEMGWLGVAAPEASGGIGGGVVTAAVLAEEAGRGILPGPFLSSLTAALAAESCGDDVLLGEIIEGRSRVALAVEEPGGSWGPDAVCLAATPCDEGWSLSGTKILVRDGQEADVLLVVARAPDGLALLKVPADVPGLARNRMLLMDGQSASELVLEDVRVGSDARLGGGEGGLLEAYEKATVLCAADLLGSAQASLELATEYAKERVQFGRPIGSFQAVSHRLADDLMKLEIGRSLLYGASLALDDRRENASALVSAAKAWLNEAAIAAVESALQIHGGVGFTWEYDVHLHMRRVRCNVACHGDADFHRDRVASHMDAALAAEGSGP